MKILAYEVRPDEREIMESAALEYGVSLVMTSAVPSMQNVEMTESVDGVTTLGQGKINAELLEKWYENGVRFLSTRTIGYDHIDLTCAEKLGIGICNANYAPNGVADFTVMLMLMCLRNYKQALWRGQVNDFALNGLQGREMRELTVGIMGTGSIGTQVMRNLSGFGCRMLCFDVRENDDAKKLGRYVDRDTLFRESDIITLHMPLLDSTYHIIDRAAIAKMKDGVVIINCARGELTETEALVEGIETEKIGALGLDALEGEEGVIHSDHRIDILANRNLFYLRQFRNVVMTPHMAFYTDAATRSMVECGIYGICAMAEGRDCPTRLC